MHRVVSRGGVDLHEFVPVGRVQGGHGAVDDIDPRRVHEDVDPAQLLVRPLDQPLGGVPLRDVARVEQNAGCSREAAGGLAELILAATGNDDMAPLSREGQGDPGTNSGAAAGDECSLVSEVSHGETPALG